MNNDYPCLEDAPTHSAVRNHWPQMSGKPAVFLAEFEIPADHPLNPAKATQTIALFSGKSPGSHGTEIHYQVLELGTNYHREHHLYQGGKGVAYKSKEVHEREAREPAEVGRLEGPITPEIQEWLEFGGDVMQAVQQLTGATNEPQSWWKELLSEYQEAGKPKAKKKWLCAKLKPRFHWLSHRPRWAEAEGMWCYRANQPMVFLGQVPSPEDETVPDGAPQGDMLYLFFDRAGSGLEFQVIAQMCGGQTAEAHYRLEEQLARFQEMGGGPKAANELVQKGDRWAHRFLLDLPELARQTLELLVKQGATRQLKDEAAARLKGAG